MRTRLLSLPAMAAMLLACGSDRVPAHERDARTRGATERALAPTPTGAAREHAGRRVTTAAPRLVWTTPTSLALDMPSALAAADGQLFVADAGAGRVMALDATTGTERWRTGSAPGIPGGLLAPVALAVTPSGVLAVLDPSAGRIHLLGADGAARRTLRLAEDVAPRRLCATAAGGFLVAGTDARGRLLLLDRDGHRDAHLALPWADADSLGDLRLQAVLGGSPDGTRCVAALKLGRGFAIVQPATPPHMLAGAYVERIPLPPLQVSEQGTDEARVRRESIGDAPLAARDVAVSSSTVAILFQGTSPGRARLVDLHALADGAYRATIPLPVQAHAIALLGDTLFALHRQRGAWAISALHAPSLSDRPDGVLALGAR